METQDRRTPRCGECNLRWSDFNELAKSHDALLEACELAIRSLHKDTPQPIRESDRIAIQKTIMDAKEKE